MSGSSARQAVTDNFIERTSGQSFAGMKICLDTGGCRCWTNTDDLGKVLAGGICGGLTFAFPGQGAAKRRTGTSSDRKPIYRDAFGLSNGETIDYCGVRIHE